jgi:hypothetical protein
MEPAAEFVHKFVEEIRNKQVGGDHYRAMGLQPWDVLKQWLTPAEYRGYHKGVIIAYLGRESRKGGTLDLEKAAHHLEELINFDHQLSGKRPF